MEPERRHRYQKTISYDLEIKMEGESLLMEMEVVEGKISSQY